MLCEEWRSLCSGSERCASDMVGHVLGVVPAGKLAHGDSSLCLCTAAELLHPWSVPPTSERHLHVTDHSPRGLLLCTPTHVKFFSTLLLAMLHKYVHTASPLTAGVRIVPACLLGMGPVCHGTWSLTTVSFIGPTRRHHHFSLNMAFGCGPKCKLDSTKQMQQIFVLQWHMRVTASRLELFCCSSCC